MKPIGLDPKKSYVWKRSDGKSTEVRFVEYLPPRTPVEIEGAAYDGAVDMRQRCKIQEIQTGETHDVWIADLEELAG